LLSHIGNRGEFHIAEQWYLRVSTELYQSTDWITPPP